MDEIRKEIGTWPSGTRKTEILGNRTAKTAVYETIETPPPGEIRFYRIREQAWGVSES